MRPKVLEISWHETQAVYSCDFQPLPLAQLKRLLAEDDHDSSSSSSKDKEKEKVGSSSAGPIIAGGRQYRLATGGGDSKVRLWMVHPNIPSTSAAHQATLTGSEITPHPPRAEYLATLSKHSAAVNCVRFSPNGATLASAGDDGMVILWVPSDKPQTVFGESSDTVDKEFWRHQRVLAVTGKHIYDLAWSPDSEFLIAGATDNTASIWKAATGECVYALREHTHYVQGVAWDPMNEYVATQSSDRAVHVNTFAFRNGMPDVHPVSRATRFEIRHSRTPSIPSGSRPNFVRRGSNVSETGSAITTASEFTEPLPLSRHLLASATASASAAPMTPSASIPSTPQLQLMDPPSTKAGSRRSSFSSQVGSPSLSTTGMRGRTGRSPSPIPPLPAIRQPSTSTQAIMQRIYGEEGVTRFFRRLTFSPDGSLLLTPAGQIEDQLFKGSPMLMGRTLSHDGDLPLPKPKNVEGGKPTVYIYSRANLSKAPVAHLPGHKTSSVAIRFSPIFYDLRTTSSSNNGEPKQITLDRNVPGPVHVSLMPPPPPPPTSEKDEKKEKEKEQERPIGSIFALPYRMLYAVACQDAVLLYDTQQAGPIAIFRGLHYAGFTDVAWSPDGQTLMLSSADGYCSIVVFDMSELGVVHATQQHNKQLAAIAQHHSHQSISVSVASTPITQSPSTIKASPVPSRTDREGSSVSSINFPPQSSSTPLFNPGRRSSTTSSIDPVMPTPGEENEGFAFPRISVSGSESGQSTADRRDVGGKEGKRVEEGREDAPKKKRRVMLSKVADE